MNIRKDFWVVGVGASAGGLEALSAFFKSLPEAPPAAFIVAQHLAPHAKSMMVELLSRQTPLPVVAIRDKLKLKPAHIYIAPPNYDISMQDGELRLTKAGAKTRPKPSVDSFFISLAKNHGDKAVGIILSGTGTDGSEGIRAIKENNGVIIVQDADSAKYDGMPKSAFDTGLVDLVLPPDKIAQQMFEYLENQNNPNKDELNEEETGDFDAVLDYLKKEVGTDFSQYKISTIQRRVEKRLAKHNISNIKDYFHFLKGNRTELSALAQEMLVSVTSFFRDGGAFAAFAAQLEQIILKKDVNEELRIWVAGCATGEEPYSIAFLVNELCEKHLKPLPVKIFATDLDQEALNQSRSGQYSKEEVAHLDTQYLNKYFLHKEKYFEVKKYIRDMVVYARQDLTQNPPFVKLDVVSCRNVLIYFESKLQARIFDIFHYALKPDGLLFLGKSESAPQSLFELQDKKSKLFKRLNVTNNLTQAAPTKYSLASATLAGTRRISPNIPNVTEVATAQMLKHFNLSGVVIDEDGVIAHIIGDVTGFVTFPVGQADFRLSNLLPKNIAMEFSVLLKKSAKETKVMKSRTFKGERSQKRSFSLTIQPLEEYPEAGKPLYLVTFEHKKTEILPEELHSSEVPKRMIELEQELTETKVNLQTVIEELEVSNEELQSLNEELSSTNEELQASNEELETTNEELQSTNEELMTLNEELSIKSSELRLLNSSLENIQTSLSAPLLVLDSNLSILKYNPSANQVFQLTHSDVGLSILKASCTCEIPDFEKALRQTLATGKTAETKCESGNRIYQIRIHPNRDESKKIIGLIVIFFDNTDFMLAQDHLKMSDRRIRSIIDGSPNLIFLKDAMGRYLTVNRAFTELFNVKEADVLGKTDREIFPEKMANQFRDHDLEVLLKRTNIETQEDFEFKNERLTFITNRFPLYGTNERNPYAVGTVALDITKQVKSQSELKLSEARYKAIVEDQTVLVCRHDISGKITYCNNSFQKYFDTKKIKVTSSFLNFIDSSDQLRIKLELARLSHLNPIIQYETKVTNPEGQIRWVRWIHKALLDSHNNVIEFQAVGFDVTDVHNKTAELLDKESLYTHVLEHTSDFLSIYRVEGSDFILESYNQSSSERALGPSRLLGKNLKDILGTGSANILFEFEKTLTTKAITTFEEQINGPAGERHLSTTLVPIFETNGHRIVRIVSISKDITNIKRVEHAIKIEKKKSDAANKAKSDFLASMSHELRTPLNVIMGMSQLLTRAQLKPEHQRLIESIQRSGKVLLSLIEDVLDLSRIEAGKIKFDSKPFSLEQLIKDVLLSFESQASQKKIALNHELSIRPVPLLGDQVRLKQVLMNLIGNAVKFTEKGSVTLKTRFLTEETSSLQTLHFEIIDTGIGIPEDSFHKIFKRFSQADQGTSRKFGGTGLGLAICKQLVEHMNGSIGFDSKEGQGSTFWFRIQLPVADSPLLTQGAGIQPPTNLSELKIMAVDDNPESLKVLRFMFEELGGQLLTATSGSEAISILGQQEVDLVFMDMQMPGLDGLETTRMIRSATINKHVPIVALTANAMPGDRDLCLSAGMNDYLTKPIDFQALNQAMLKWAGQRVKS